MAAVCRASRSHPSLRAAKGLAPGSVRNTLAPVRALLATAFEEGLIRSNPAAGLRLAQRVGGRRWRPRTAREGTDRGRVATPARADPGRVAPLLRVPRPHGLPDRRGRLRPVGRRRLGPPACEDPPALVPRRVRTPEVPVRATRDPRSRQARDGRYGSSAADAATTSSCSRPGGGSSSTPATSWAACSSRRPSGLGWESGSCPVDAREPEHGSAFTRCATPARRASSAVGRTPSRYRCGSAITLPPSLSPRTSISYRTTCRTPPSSTPSPPSPMGNKWATRRPQMTREAVPPGCGRFPRFPVRTRLRLSACLWFPRPFNPKVAGSNPARPTSIAGSFLLHISQPSVPAEAFELPRKPDPTAHPLRAAAERSGARSRRGRCKRPPLPPRSRSRSGSSRRIGLGRARG